MSLETPTASPIETLTVAGLSDAADIRVDTWGIPHLSASNSGDLFFLQGFNAARDRLWQIDLWRKRGLGLLAASFGPGYLAQDCASRAFLFRGDMEAEWTSYAPDAREICRAFVSGINAYVELTEREPSRLPSEFRMTGTRPAKWQPEDVVRIRSHALTRNALSEVMRACILAHHEEATDLLRKNLEPAVVPRNDGKIDPASVPLAVLDLFKLATAGVTFSEDRLNATLADADQWTKLNDLAEVVSESTWTGSNNWAVAADRTETGRPVIAGDPHRNHAMPSLRYLVQLSCPEFDVIGAGEPAVPGISMGHNGTIAFTQTIFGSDQEDIYVYETEPGNPDRYRYGGEWVAMEIAHERFAVKGEDDQIRPLRFTRHGPVLYADPEARTAFAIRSVWFEPSAGAYLAGLSSMRAKNLEEFKSAIRRFATPSLNHVYADVAGTIAWLPFGMTPIRRNWDGLLPVPGDGRFEWDGFVAIDDMPNLINPASGYVASANEANMPADWDHERTRIGYEWLEKSRALRLHEVLGSTTSHSVAASVALQTDVMSLPGRRLQNLLRAIEPGEDQDFNRARTMLLDWDNALHVNSAPGALSEFWFTRHLKPALFELFIPDAKLRALLAPGDVEGILRSLENPDHHFGADAAKERDRLLTETLAAAYRDLVERFGADSSQWRWGDLHHGYFEHPLSGIAGEESRRTLDVGPLPKGGSASTIMHAAYRPQDFRVTTGASVRFVLDVGNWDASVCMNAPGQSGDSRSPHYRDLSALWAKGDYVPFLYSRNAVDAATEQRIRLLPATTSDAFAATA
ncbi:penicillin acylase family protein [Microvirga brassicacearum]|uniref:Penicillin acylase family protein n=1 Tax=Microvirga brassicacearum TaxID=2580413 RepID=A0A5N3P6G2_9HYPH|nr:penicillin acylase family protein [Microvirga brassicacearum]KAB0265336.1 penicillin acylase family protein [Microvirga brassicacearum]